MDRRFTFSNAKIIEALTSQFIPVSGDCSEMQFSKTRTSSWFMNIAYNIDNAWLQKQLSPPDHTAQGFYIIAADGTSYGWMNDHNPEEVMEFLAAGLKRYKENSLKDTNISQEELT